MDVEKNDLVIVLDRGKELEEVVVMGGCCIGRPSAASSGISDRS